MMGGSLAHEFMFLNPAGEDVLVLCEACGYAANRQVAPTIAPEPARGGAPRRSRRSRRPTRPPSTRWRRSSACPTSRTAKATFFVTGDGRFVVAIVRGDYDVNETKLVNAIKATGGLRPAQVEEITARGMEPGYGSPIGARDALVVVDALAARSPNLVAGANRPGCPPAQRQRPARLHAGRDHRHRERPRGRPLPRLRRDRDPAQRHRGRQHLQARDEVHGGAGRRVPGRGRRAPPDRHGLVRHRPRAQRRLHRGGAPRREGHRLARRGRARTRRTSSRIGANKNPEVTEIAERLHDLAAQAAARTHEILYDDRDESPGVKFTDAELLGMPWILTVSPRSLAAGGDRGHEPRDRREGRPRDRGRRGLPGRPRADARLTGAGPAAELACPARLVPDDDLYARLEVALDASPEAIELAWRALLKRHHPDVAGDDAEALDRAKRINVAHDWLSDPALRARYDADRLGLAPRPPAAPAGAGYRPRAARGRRGRRQPGLASDGAAPAPGGPRARTSSAATPPSASPGSSPASSG